MVCVRPGVLLVRASAFLATSALMALDLPTLERPANAISGGPGGGSSEPRPAARKNAACALGALAAALLVVAAYAQDKAQGIASQVCAACHGADGNSVAPANPKIAGQIPEYLQKQLHDFKALGGSKPVRESSIMNGMVANLSDADMK